MILPAYQAPDFNTDKFRNAPDATWVEAPKDGVAPEGFHSTSMFPEYFKIDGQWVLASKSRMDSSVVIAPDGELRNFAASKLKLSGVTLFSYVACPYFSLFLSIALSMQKRSEGASCACSCFFAFGSSSFFALTTGAEGSEGAVS